MRRAVFLDLNGTLVMPVQVTSPAEYMPIPGSVEAVRLLHEAGFLCPVVTVQSRIQKGIYTQQAFLDWFAGFQASFAAQGATLLGVYLCPHHSRAGCDCHKPKTALYERAAADWAVDLSRSYVVGDTLGDIQAGLAIGATPCLVGTGWASRTPEAVDQAAFVAEDILAAAKWIVGNR